MDEKFLYVLLTLSQEQNIKTGRFSIHASMRIHEGVFPSHYLGDGRFTTDENDEYIVVTNGLDCDRLLCLPSRPAASLLVWQQIVRVDVIDDLATVSSYDNQRAFAFAVLFQSFS